MLYKKLAIAMLSLLFVLCGCGSSEETAASPTPSASPSDTASLSLVTSAISDDISDEDFQMYNEIMEALNAEPDKSEDEILASLESKYGMTVEELKQFLNDHMEAAIARSMGDTERGSANEPSFIELITYAQTAVEKTVGKKVYISTQESDWEVSKTGLRYVLASSITVNGDPSDAIIKIEFDDDTYQTYTMFQLKINGADIDLSSSTNAQQTPAYDEDATGSGQTYLEGTHKVGSDIPEGVYFAVADSNAFLPSLTVRDGSGSDAKVLMITMVENFSIIGVSDGEYLEVSGCVLIDIAASKPYLDIILEQTSGAYPAGTYKVGFHIPAGEYKVAPLKDAVLPTYTIYADATRQTVKDIKMVEGQGYVTLKEGEIFDLSGAALVP